MTDFKYANVSCATLVYVVGSQTRSLPAPFEGWCSPMLARDTSEYSFTASREDDCARRGACGASDGPKPCSPNLDAEVERVKEPAAGRFKCKSHDLIQRATSDQLRFMGRD